MTARCYGFQLPNREAIQANSTRGIRKERKLLIGLLCLLFFNSPFTTHAQESVAFKEQRAEEQYASFKDSTNLSWPNALKYIPLSADRKHSLSIGGSYRPRFEHFSNNNWIAGNDNNYYSQRVSFHTDWRFGQYLRFFGELYHGYKTGGTTFLQSDDLDWHQGMVEIMLPLDNGQVSARLGRQEMKLGAGRLVDLRIGPNMRRSFDMGKINFDRDKLHLVALILHAACS